MPKIDVIVVGAGQAGCAAAFDLAAAGQHVLLLDKPQHKPCAGGVTMKSLERLRFPIDELVRERPLQLDLSLRGRRRLHWPLKAPMCVLVERRHLDDYCLRQALQQGAAYRRIHAITGVRQHTRWVEVDCDGSTFTAAALIAADGAHSPMRRLLVGGEKATGAYALEARVAVDKATHYPGMTLDFAATPQGYGWLFPKGDHINVGLYASRLGGTLPNRAALLSYTKWALGSDCLEAIRGYPLGTRMGRLCLAAGRVLFAGDAAGSCEPLLGEGIYGAIVTGQLAARAILTQKAADIAAVYTASCAAWRREVSQLNALARLFYAAPPLAYGGLHHGLRRRLTHGYAAGLTPLQSLRRPAADGRWQ